MSDWTTFIQAYQNASEEQKALIDDGEISNVFSDVSLDNKTITNLVQLLADVILRITPYTKLEHEISNTLLLSEESQKDILNTTRELLKNIPNQSHQTFVTAPEKDEAGTPHVVEPLRTLEGDMKKVHGYGAYVGQQEQPSEVTHKSEQSNTLKKPPLADRPSYTN